jgi:serine/threonine-protein kinase
MAESQLAHEPTLAAPAVAAERLPEGAAAGEYVVDRFLGAGAMGEVYAGRHPVIGKRVAIKVLKRELAATAEGAERFIREARAVNQVRHGNVIDVFAFGRLADGRLYLAMDLVEGKSLRAALEDGPLSAEAALAILAQVADALDAAHARGVVHRDLKPDNVMITDETPPKVFVLDFGIAKLVAEGGGGGNGTLTGQGAWLGTPGYMAPEQWSADGAGPASDRYALGVMAFELLSGKLPFQAPSLPQMMEQHFRAPVPALTARGGGAGTATFDPVLSRAMAKDPTKRFATARELVEALAAAGRNGKAGKGGKAGKAGKATRTGKGAAGAAEPAEAGQRRPWLPALAGTGVLGLAVVAVVATRGGSSEGGGAGERGSDEPRPIEDPAAGFARVEVVTRPAGASVWRGGRLLGATPASIEVRRGEAVELELRKPGYAPQKQTVTAREAAAQVAVELAPQNGFEGVWALPDGQLRAFRRSGEAVDVYKLRTVAGEREFHRKLALEEPPAASAEEVVFAASEVMIDRRGAHEPSCQISHRIEYHYDPHQDALDVRPEQVNVRFVDGRCIVSEKLPGAPLVLVRADRGADDGRWSQAPVGKPRVPAKKIPPRKGPPKEDFKLPNDTLDNPADVKQKTVPPVPPEPATGNANADAPDDLKQAPNTQQAAPQQAAPQQAAPQPQAPQAPPRSKAPVNAPQQQLPRGDSQVAPQVQQPDTNAQQQQQRLPQKK